MNRCTCGHIFAEKDIGLMETAPAAYLPYEGEVYTLVCPDCGCLTDLKGSEVEL
jgi:hypothetical protein